MGRKEKIYSTYESNASQSDILTIDKDLQSMNRGKVKDIWTKVQALYQLIKDPEAAWQSKAMAIGSLVYLVSPIDAIPDPIPVLGLSDDVAIIIATLATLGVQINKYLIGYQREKGEITKNNILEIEAEIQKSINIANSDNQKNMQRFILKLVSITGFTAIVITLIIKIL